MMVFLISERRTINFYSDLYVRSDDLFVLCISCVYKHYFVLWIIKDGWILM